MLHLFLVILKIIGIVCVCLIGVLLLLVLAVLFIPFYYQAEGAYNSLVDVKKASIKGKVSFLGPFLTFKFWLDEEFCWDLKLLFFSLKRFAVKEKKDLAKENSKEEDFFFEKSFASDEAQQNLNTNDKSDLSDENRTDKEPDLQEENFIMETAGENKKSKSKSLSERFSELKQKVKELLKKIKKLFSKIKEIVEVIQELMDDERFKASFLYGKDEVVKVLKKIWPQIQYMTIYYGTGDPALSGQILGAVSVLNGMTGTNIELLPDFDAEKFFFDGKGKLRGKIRVFNLVKLWYKYMWDKEIKYFKYKIKKVRRRFQ